jgi:23S rRNA pseudouridine2457 synthase
MAQLLLLNKPFNVLCQFTDNEGRKTLADYVNTPNIYPAGRLDYDSEGLVLLTDSGALQARIADPKNKMVKTYWVQVEGSPDNNQLDALRKGVTLNDGPTRPAKVAIIEAPDIWDRSPPIRQRANDLTTWLQIEISEGRNRQVRRMTAHIGHPTLRLVRVAIGPWSLDGIKQPGTSHAVEVHLPKTMKTKEARPRRTQTRNGAGSHRKSNRPPRRKS